MKFALVEGQRREAQPNLSGVCQSCSRRLVAKCGERKAWHWAHQARSACDAWWENETEWHRAWKSAFPVDWQEVIHRAANGEKHIADVKTSNGWVIEFQHSFIPPEERRSRDSFYGRLIWVVDGTRRKRDSAQFLKTWESGLLVNPLVRRALWDENALLREWSGSSGLVFFDFGDDVLWWLLPAPLSRWAYVAKYSRGEFIKIHRGDPADATGNFDSLVNSLSEMVQLSESFLKSQVSRHFSQPLPGFQRYLTQVDRRRRRF